MRVLNGAVADVNGAKAVLNGAIIVLNGAMTSSQLKDSCSPRSGSIFDKAMSVFKQSSNGAICANFQRSEGICQRTDFSVYSFQWNLERFQRNDYRENVANGVSSVVNGTLLENNEIGKT